MNSTTSSGLLLAIVSFLANITLGILFPLCGPLCGVVWGAAAGALAIVRSPDRDGITSPAREGAVAGAIAGVGALAGLMAGIALSYGPLGGNEVATDLYEEWSAELGVPPVSGDALLIQQWLGALGLACCLGLIALAVQAGAGALGAWLAGSRSASL